MVTYHPLIALRGGLWETEICYQHTPNGCFSDPLLTTHKHNTIARQTRFGSVLQVKMEKEAQIGAQEEEVLSLELPAPLSWKKLVSPSLSTYKNLSLFFFFSNLKLCNLFFLLCFWVNSVCGFCFFWISIILYVVEFCFLVKSCAVILLITWRFASLS